MKKIIYKYLILIFLAFNFSNCNDDDKTLDPIIGEWKLISMQIDNDVYSQQNECTSKSRVIYYDNGTRLQKTYSSAINIPCHLSESRSNWRNLGNSMYIFGTQEIASKFSDNNTIHEQTTESFDPVQNKNVILILTYKRI